MSSSLFKVGHNSYKRSSKFFRWWQFLGSRKRVSHLHLWFRLSHNCFAGSDSLRTLSCSFNVMSIFRIASPMYVSSQTHLPSQISRGVRALIFQRRQSLNFLTDLFNSYLKLLIGALMELCQELLSYEFILWAIWKIQQY